MTFALRVRRAMYDRLPSYNRDPDHNWDEQDSISYYNFCNKFGGTYTQYPTTAGQSEDFINLIDKYEDIAYTSDHVEEVKEQKSGTDLRQLMPDRQPIPDGSAEEKRARNAIINENVNVQSPSNSSTSNQQGTVSTNVSIQQQPTKNAAPEQSNDPGDAAKSNEVGNENNSNSDAGAKELAKPEVKSPEKPKAPENARSKHGNNVPSMKIKVR